MDDQMRFRWYITKRHLVALVGLLVAIILLMAFTSCIPVTVRPEFDDKGLPKALPVTPVGTVTPEGALVPVYEVSHAAPQPPADWWPMVQNALLVALGLLTGTGAGTVMLRRGLGKAQTAIRIVSELADANAKAETDEEVEHNKRVALQRQLQANVHNLTQTARGKA